MLKITLKSLKKIFKIEKKLVFSILLLFTFFGAIIQTLNIILVGPLVLTFFNPELILQTKIVNNIKTNYFDISEGNIFIIICIAFLITFILSNLISLLKNTIQIYFIQRIKISTSSGLLNKFFKSEINNIRTLQKSDLDRIINVVTDKFASFSASIFTLIEAGIYIFFVSVTIIIVNKFVVVGLALVILLFLFFYLIFNNLNKKFYTEEIEIKKIIYFKY